MAMNKEELRERIKNLPLFEKREVKVKNDTEEDESVDFEEWTKQPGSAICEVGKRHAYSYVGKNYTLVQFKDIFLPMLDSIEGDAEGYLCDYGGYASLKWFPKLDELKDGDDRFGLIATNSVDMSSAIIIRFCVEHRGQRFSIPSKIAGLKKQHTGDVGHVIKDYISLVGQVKAAWKTIIDKFPKYRIVKTLSADLGQEILEVEIGDVIENLNLGTRFNKKLVEKVEQKGVYGKYLTLWDVFTDIIQEISNNNYKSEVHRDKKIDKVCQAIFDYSMVLGL